MRVDDDAPDGIATRGLGEEQGFVRNKRLTPLFEWQFVFSWPHLGRAMAVDDGPCFRRPGCGTEFGVVWGVQAERVQEGPVLRWKSMKTVTRRISVLAGAVAALSLHACAGQSDTSPCAIDDDCDGDRICQSGVCFDRCAAAADCAPGRGCLSGLCVPLQSCASGQTCPGGTVCEDGVCQIQQPECLRSSECPPNLRCVAGACIVDPGACDGPSDCPVGQDCVNTRCVPGDGYAPGDTAGTDAVTPDTISPPDTAPETVAPTDLAIADSATDADDVGPTPECVRPEDCGTGARCDNGTCVADPCEGREDGRLGETCEAASDCCNGMCLGNPRTGAGRCTDTCEVWRDCNPVGTGVRDLFCYRAEGLPSPLCAQSDFGVPCASPSDCLEGLCLSTQLGGRTSCTWRCRSSLDCPSGTACAGFPTGSGTAYACAPIGEGPCGGDGRLCFGTYCLTSDLDPSVDYCTASCRQPADCPEGWACVDAGGGLSVCERR
jgi:hypothetical protein